MGLRLITKQKLIVGLERTGKNKKNTRLIDFNCANDDVTASRKNNERARVNELRIAI
jgi:hypothetical protein